MSDDAKREKIIKIRVSPEELATLQMHCTKGELARWMRETCLNPGQSDLVEDLKGPSKVAPSCCANWRASGTTSTRWAAR